MRKLLIIAFAFTAFCQTTLAQVTYTGTVVDSKGTPMPGAKVQVKGTDESVITNMDGTFVVETSRKKPKFTAKYAGWNAATKTASNGMTIKMSRSSWFSEKPSKYEWFGGVGLAFSRPDITPMSPGIVIGRVKNWGWYVKGHYNGKAYNLDDVDYTPYYGSYYVGSGAYHTGDLKHRYASVILGGLVRLGCPIYLNCGVGYAFRSVGVKTISGDYMKLDNHNKYDELCGTESLGTIDLGLTLRIRKFFVQGGVELNVGDDDPYTVGTMKVGMFF